MQINGSNIEAGKHEIVELPVAQLPSGNPINLHAHVFRSSKPGPTMLVLGGVHGDEINGMEIVRQSITNGLFNRLSSGNVIAIPVLNVYGFINFSREVPDGKDVNRSFPGTSKGSLASRVAYTLHKHILPLTDFGLDFHTGGRSNYNYPQIRYTLGHEESEQLAKAFSAPLTLAYKAIQRSLRKVALDKHDVPMLVFEGGENLRYDGFSIQEGLDGIQRVMAAKGMITKKFPPKPTMNFEKTSWLRANRGGLFQWMKSSGNWVKKGEPLGFINDPHGHGSTKYINAPNRGYIIGHNNTPVVSQGDALFHLAYEE